MTPLEHQTVNNGDEQQKILDILASRCGVERSNQTCGSIWDGILCWAPSPAGLHLLPCPHYIVGFDSRAYASKYCYEDGTWKDWTNFTLCSNEEEPPTILVPTQNNDTQFWEAYVPLIRQLSHAGYGTSLISLTIAFFVLATFKRLRCPRNMLHLHLFASFILRAFMNFLRSFLFEEGIGPVGNFAVHNGTRYFHQEQSNWGCKAMTTLWQYFIAANYSWVLMEGLYIHNLIMWALSADGSSILIYIILGWGLPMIFIPVWGITRAVFDDNLCWTINEKKGLDYIISVPTTLSLLINFGLFINIFRLLMKKVKSTYKEEAQRYWQLAKSTLVLFALFGVPYVIIYGLYFGDDIAHLAWLICDQLFASFQGFFISLLYCFLNREVIEELQRRRKDIVHAGRLAENNFPTTSFASWSSSHSTVKRKCDMLAFFHLLHQCFTCRQRPESRASKRTETVDCIICETCTPHPHDSKGLHAVEKQCNHGAEQEDVGVEMKLMGTSSVA